MPIHKSTLSHLCYLVIFLNKVPGMQTTGFHVNSTDQMINTPLLKAIKIGCARASSTGVLPSVREILALLLLCLVGHK